ncbi:MAG: Spy/CpxP family protein refolding chaperone [Pseudomonadota bacterium]
MARFLSTLLAFSMAIALPIAMPVWADHQAGADKGEPSHQGMMQHHFDKIAEHFKQLKQELKLNPTQTAAYDKLMKRYEEQADKIKLHHEEWKKQDYKSLTAVQMMEQHVARLNEHSKEATQNLEEFKSFYATLTPEQQKKVDEFCRKMHHHPGAHHDRRMKVGAVGHVPVGEKPAAPAPSPAP